MSTRLAELRRHPVGPAIALVAAFDDVPAGAGHHAIAEALGRHGVPVAPRSGSEARRLEELARAIHAVFAARGDERAAALDRLLDDHDVRLRAGGTGADLLRFDGARRDRIGRWSAELAGWTALAAWQFADRLGACAATDCSEVYVDTTRNGSQRFCSSTCVARRHAQVKRRGGGG